MSSRSRTIGAALVSVAIAALAVRGGGPAIATAAAPLATWAIYGGLGDALPSLGAAFHARVAASERATLLSLRSLAGYAGAWPPPSASDLAEATGLPAAWTVAAFAAALTATALVTAPAWTNTAHAEESRVVP
jgi:hypothetical protein